MDPYETLGVPQEADADTIKKAFRARARECHPDRAGNTVESQERFNAVKQAYEILRDEIRRAFYDRYNCDGVSLGLDQSGMQGALRSRGGMRIERGDKVPRSECTKCSGTGIRPSGRSCQACDPNLSPDIAPAPASTPLDAGRGQRVRLRPDPPPESTGRPMRNRTNASSAPPPEAGRVRTRNTPREAPSPPPASASVDDLFGNHGGRVRLRPKKKKP